MKKKKRAKKFITPDDIPSFSKALMFMATMYKQKYQYFLEEVPITALPFLAEDRPQIPMGLF